MKKGGEDIRSLAVRNVLAGKDSITQVAEMTGWVQHGNHIQGNLTK